MTTLQLSRSIAPKDLRADVLVLGGGPAGCAAALAAAARGASVVLADKGHVGTSGAAASAGVGVWYIDDEPAARQAAMASRETLGGHLADRGWMERVLDETHAQVDRIADWGYRFPIDSSGREARGTLQGPELMRLMRRQVARARVRILDHAPALELLRGDDGSVAGARGVLRQRGEAPWQVVAGAVVIATGGCGFLAGGIGCHVLTGDGHLMAAEVGADFSGMEFSNAYAISPTFSSVTKTAIYHHARFLHADGSELEGAGSQRGRSVLARALLEEPVYAVIDGWPEEEREPLRRSQPNFFLSFDRFGIDPFTQPFPITLRLEGTIRGTGGLRLTGENCATSVPGLYAAGDAATRELICGGFTGGGSHNSAWALSSGRFAGAGAAAHASRVQADRHGDAPERTGTVGLQAGAASSPLAADVIDAVKAEVHPYEKNYFRTGEGLERSLGELDRLWAQLREQGVGDDSASVVRRREAAAMTAHARWMYTSAIQRTETRGMHKRLDTPALDPAQQHRQLVGGLDELWTSVDPIAPAPSLAAAA